MPFRDRTMGCVRCGGPLELARSQRRTFRRCGACRGAWISHDVIRGLFHEMIHGAEPRYQSAPATGCGEHLSRTLLVGIRVDRCERDGVWFDQNELAQSLENLATGAREQPPAEEAARSLLDEFFSSARP
jgi:Zn-finger nucleic acid-binding protein